METREQKLKNRIKNVILLVLFVGMVVLTAITWLSGLNLESMPEDSMLAKIYQRVTYGVSGFEMRTGSDPAAEPTRIAVSGADGLVGAQYQTASVSMLYSVLRDPMGEALDRAETFHACTEKEFMAALRGEVLYFGYEGELPLTLLSGWMGGAVKDLRKTDLLLLTKEGELFLHGEDGYQRAKTRADARVWREAVKELSAGACSFAAQEKSGIVDNVRPDTLLFDSEPAAAERLNVRYPGFLEGQSGSDLTALLEAFEYDPYVRNYQEDKGGTRVFVENYSTLHISANGAVSFHTSAMEGALEAYVTTEGGEDESLRLQTDFAYTLLRQVQASMSDASQAMLFDVTDGEDGVRVLSFVQLVGGVPVETETYRPFAWFEFRGNRLMEVRLQLRIFEPSGERTLLLPGRQAAAAAPSEGLRPLVAYMPTVDGKFTARRCYRK